MDDGYNAAITSPLVWEIDLLGRISPGSLTWTASICTYGVLEPCLAW